MIRTDMELLELAAKAAGLEYRPEHELIKSKLGWHAWNPLTDDGDALRLAAQLGISIELDDQQEIVTAWWNSGTLGMMQSQDIGTLAAYRRAITRAAAEIGASL